MSTVLLLHVFATFFMTGISWIMSLIHYPTYYVIDKKEFTDFEKKHIQYTSYLTFPGLLLETMTGIWLLFHYAYADAPLLYYSLALIVFNFIATFGWFVPLHFKLTKQYNEDKVKRLNQTHWLRTISWTVRSFCIFMYLIG